MIVIVKVEHRLIYEYGTNTCLYTAYGLWNHCRQDE